MDKQEMPSELHEIRKKLYTTNQYNVEHQSVGALLSNEDKSYLRENFDVDKDDTLHRMCVNCQARQLIKYYNVAPDNGEVNKFAVRCEGVPKQLKISKDALDMIMADKDMSRKRASLYLKSTMDPVAWCHLMFGFDDSVDEWRLRDYQKEQLRCNSLRMVIREGRRSGKTFIIALKLLYMAFNKIFFKGYDSEGNEIRNGPEIMIVTPYQSQVSNIFNEMERILKRSKELCNQVSTGTAGSLYVKTPFSRMEFNNGAKIYGFVSGVGTKIDGSGGGTMRGQCLPAGTLIYQFDGSLKAIEDTKEGDLVQSYTDRGMVVAPVSKVFEPQEKEIFEIKLQSGRTFQASKDHAFAGCNFSRSHRKRLMDKGSHSLKWQPVEDWRAGDRIALTTEFLEGLNTFGLDEIALIGLMAGDGCLTKKAWKNRNLRFCAGNSKIADYYQEITDRLGIKATSTFVKDSNVQDIRINTKGSVTKLWSLMERAGLANSFSYEKKLAVELLAGSEAQRRTLLGSLLATDGWLCTDGKKIEVAYCSTSEELAKQVQQLMLTLGVSSTLSLREKFLGGKQHRDQYIVSCKNAQGVIKLLTGTFVPGKVNSKESVLSVARNQSFDKTKNLYGDGYYLDRIVSIEPVGISITYDIEVQGTHNFIIEGGVVTHNSADIIYLDEMDMIPEEVLDKVVIPILLTTPQVMLIATSTPIGKRAKFHKWCLERPDFKEDYFPSTVLPQWDIIKSEVENENSEDGFRAEYMAEFIDGSHGVFRPSYVYAARQDYKYEDCERPSWWHEFAGVRETSDLIKVIGIDWNKNAGTEFVVVAYHPGKHHWFVVESTNIGASQFSSVKWKEEVIRLNYKWKPNYIYADEGYGHTIIEDLKLLGYQTKGKKSKDRRDFETAQLPERLVSFNFSSKVDLTSPIDGTDFTKPGKEYLVENAIRIFEDGKIWYPEVDDAMRKQLLNYIILRRSPTTNKPIYGSENKKVGDHRLDALMLALAGLSLEFSVYSKNSSVLSEPAFYPKAKLDKRSASKAGGSALDMLMGSGSQPDKHGRRHVRMEQGEFLKKASDLHGSRTGRRSGGRGTMNREQASGILEEMLRRATNHSETSRDPDPNSHPVSRPSVVTPRRSRKRSFGGRGRGRR